MIQLSHDGTKELRTLKFTNGEIRALEQFLKCKSQQEMAAGLYVVVNTFKYHMTNIYKKTETKSSHELWQFLINLKIIEDVHRITITKEVIKYIDLPVGKPNEF